MTILIVSLSKNFGKQKAVSIIMNVIKNLTKPKGGKNELSGSTIREF
jgi:hypothetical protein